MKLDAHSRNELVLDSSQRSCHFGVAIETVQVTRQTPLNRFAEQQVERALRQLLGVQVIEVEAAIKLSGDLCH